MSGSSNRSRLKTSEALSRAVDSIVADGGKLSISSVAKAAGVTPGLIHNTYPDVAEQIRKVMGKSTRAQRDSKHQALVDEREKSRILRAENEQLLAEIAQLASVNQRLLLEMAQLKGIADDKVVIFPTSRSPV
ncbi:TetR family transcriptional regulator [Pseudomonas kribbensis]|uniref:TetR family transcriptional regulator n=1 Tax=Pseudomonas kribbensis TaxID=1628086 RepID=UPI003D7724DA